MKVPQIIRIPILPFGMVNAHLIRGEGGCILVDAGIPGSETKIERMLARHGLSFKDIKLIVVTHAHVDHAGSAHAIRELSRAPIVAHVDDAKPEPKWKFERFSQHFACSNCGRGFEPLNPHHFSFNAPLGWCASCEGLGVQQGASQALVIRDPLFIRGPRARSARACAPVVAARRA